MKKNIFIWLSIAIFIFILFTFTAQAGVATDRIKTATDKLLEIINNHDLDPPEMADKRERMIRETVDTVFDWRAFSQRALGRHWRKLGKEEKSEFITLFGQLIERTYMDKTRQYSGQQMNYISEEMEEKYGIVNAEVAMKNEANIAIQFRVLKKNETWFVYDVYVEGVSLVNNYRVQFNKIMTKSGYGELVSKLKTKLDEKK
ncbi:MAG: ABC transporter substrate-binding protein [Desulfobacteraceae bacterium]|jgi:phospholipid transport system substrate-binding protein